MKHENIDTHSRVWPGLQTVDGRTLELAPGEIGDVATDEPIDDPYLKPVAIRRRGKSDTPDEGESTTTDQPAKPDGGDAAKEA